MSGCLRPLKSTSLRCPNFFPPSEMKIGHRRRHLKGWYWTEGVSELCLFFPTWWFFWKGNGLFIISKPFLDLVEYILVGHPSLNCTFQNLPQRRNLKKKINNSGWKSCIFFYEMLSCDFWPLSHVFCSSFFPPPSLKTFHPETFLDCSKN